MSHTENPNNCPKCGGEMNDYTAQKKKCVECDSIFGPPVSFEEKMVELVFPGTGKSIFVTYDECQEIKKRYYQ